MNVFGSAHVVVGPHGAGLANLLMCPDGTSLVMLPSCDEKGCPSAADSYFGYLASALNFDVRIFFFDFRNLVQINSQQYILTAFIFLFVIFLNVTTSFLCIVQVKVTTERGPYSTFYGNYTVGVGEVGDEVVDGIIDAVEEVLSSRGLWEIGYRKEEETFGGESLGLEL